MKQFTFKLVQKAKTVGGDRYECSEVIVNNKPWTVYFPQELIRINGEPKELIEIHLNDENILPQKKLTLRKRKLTSN